MRSKKISDKSVFEDVCRLELINKWIDLFDETHNRVWRGWVKYWGYTNGKRELMITDVTMYKNENEKLISYDYESVYLDLESFDFRLIILKPDAKDEN